MALQRVIQHLRTSMFVEAAERTDGQLLQQFISQQDEPALEVLVRRHAPMVWGVCRRLLTNHHDAEDAFQATFLVLVRRAAAIVPRDMVANWLYGVSYQTARKVRAMSAKRKGREKQVAELPDPGVTDPDNGSDFQPILDAELSRLPDKYRIILVLSELEGKTRAAIATQLGLAEGTVASRLARARAQLAKRLAARGVALSSAPLAALLAANVASTRVPAALLASTLQAVTLLATGSVLTSVISTRVAALTDVMVKATVLAKLRTTLSVLLAIVLLGGVVGVGAASALLDRGEAPATGGALQPSREARVVRSDREWLQGRWKTVQVTVRGEAVALGNDTALFFSFADDRVSLIHGAGRERGVIPSQLPRGGFAGPGGPRAGMLAGLPFVVPGPFAGRGGPWAGIDAEQRALLFEHARTEAGSTAVAFRFRLDEANRSIDRFLSVGGVEKLVVRGVYACAGNTLRIWEGTPMQARPTPEQIASGESFLFWVFERVVPR